MEDASFEEDAEGGVWIGGWKMVASALRPNWMGREDAPVWMAGPAKAPRRRSLRGIWARSGWVAEAERRHAQIERARRRDGMDLCIASGGGGGGKDFPALGGWGPKWGIWIAGCRRGSDELGLWLSIRVLPHPANECSAA